MEKFNEFINRYKQKNKLGFNITLYDEINNFIKNWFKKLNNQDLIVLSDLTYFLINHIKNLFNITNIDQYRKNNYQDTKAILLLLLPYINEEGTNIYNNISDLNEIVCSKKYIESINSNILKDSINNIIKEYFKFSNFGVGLLNDSHNQLLNLNIDGIKLIYIIIQNNFISLLNTLSMINGKMYINWLNITPIINYYDSKIYSNTNLLLDEKNVDKIVNLDYSNYYGLYIGEFYNIYRNIFYKDIKKIKWLIYPFTFSDRKKYIIQYLNDLFEDNNLIKYDSWYDLDEITQNKMINKFKNINLNEIMVLNVWTNIFLFMVNNYTKEKLIDNEIKRNFIMDNINDEDNQDYKISEKIKFDDINNFLINIDFKLVWDFLSESIVKFKSTFYGLNLIKNNKLVNYIDESLNYKNIYNIAKGLSHHSSKKWELLPDKYDALNQEEKTNFWNKFLINPIDKWINFSNNIKIENNETDNTNVKKIITVINSKWQKKKNRFSMEIFKIKWFII